ncbi:branched-chain amino acid ABC transporter permease [Phormidium sp. FACHB-592]|uniref:Branched-chain amino acid ABC transporter permease n=1 Tax=Stenomitos frigidus AS-A4 TaxID=2933935 RepID=A0ABV0KMJ0_9CYAN|nr:branched-chain amino acid ABC transporter permease [Phormidium sp. FACHB-592]MBD2077092.1 branched-chain amino acid ABC transporter permease [Phormidium sp. FACHB-592]
MVNQLIIWLLNASTSISVLVITSLGIAITFGLMGIINFAHGELVMIGAYTVLVLTQAKVPLVWAILMAPIASGVVGLLIERLVIRHLYGRTIEILLATAGIGMVLSQLVTILFGAQSYSIPIPTATVTLGDQAISIYRLWMVLSAVCLVGLTYLMFARTRFGLEARATALNPEMASARGINIVQVHRRSFVLSAALAGVAGAILAPFTSVSPSIYTLLVTRAFITVLVGGPAVVSGTAVSAVTLGSVESAIAISTTPAFGQIAMLVCAIVLLRLFPRGISGAWGKYL